MGLWEPIADYASICGQTYKRSFELLGPGKKIALGFLVSSFLGSGLAALVGFGCVVVNLHSVYQYHHEYLGIKMTACTGAYGTCLYSNYLSKSKCISEDPALGLRPEDISDPAYFDQTQLESFCDERGVLVDLPKVQPLTTSWLVDWLSHCMSA